MMNSPPVLPATAMTVKVSGVKDDLRVREVRGHEGLGCLYEYQVELVNWDEPDSVRAALDPEGRLRPQDLLRQSLTISLPLANQKLRHLSGIITKASYLESYDKHTTYGVTIHPELWLLTLRRNCRIFQNKTVSAVVKEILGEHHIGAFRDSRYGHYRTWDTLTQYRESDFAFINRLLAQEGIYYFFEHDEDGHTLVLADCLSSHHEHTDFTTVQIGRPKPISGSDDYLTTWQARFELQSEAVTLADFDFRLKRPTAELRGRRDIEAKGERQKLEIYDTPARCVLAENQEEASEQAEPGKSREEAERLAQMRLEQVRWQSERYQGQGTVRWLATGLLFSVGDDAQQFLATATETILRNVAFRSGGPAPEEPCEVTVSAIDSRAPFRLPMMEKPLVWGPQTAWVVGGKDEEIWTDKYGRIKVQFHWDREGQSNEDSSCWLRVAQPWAGNRWGAIAIPRVGSEVVVEFLQGDPDRPLVTGSVYGGENLPPYELPEHKTRSGIKTHSSKNGTTANFNEVRFEDKKGQEELHIQAERNLSTLVKHDQSLSVQGNRSVSVGGHEDVAVKGRRDHTIVEDETQTFLANRRMTVSVGNWDEIFGMHSGQYHGGRNQIIENGDALTVIDSDKTTTVEGEYTIAANKHYRAEAGAGSPCSVDFKDGVAVIRADNEIRLECGEASLTLKKDGTVEIKGMQMSLAGSNVSINGQ